MVDQGDQGPRRQHLAPSSRPGGLGTVGFRADQAQAHGVDRHGRRKGAGDRRDPPVQRQLADGGPVAQDVGRDHPHRRQHAQGDGQVVVAALLGKIRGREVDDGPLVRKRQAQAGEGAAHPLAALAHSLVAKANDHHPGLAAGELHLDLDAARLNTLERDGHHACGHAPLHLEAT